MSVLAPTTNDMSVIHKENKFNKRTAAFNNSSHNEWWTDLITTAHLLFLSIGKANYNSFLAITERLLA